MIESFATRKVSFISKNSQPVPQIWVCDTETQLSFFPPHHAPIILRGRIKTQSWYPNDVAESQPDRFRGFKVLPLDLDGSHHPKSWINLHTSNVLGHKICPQRIPAPQEWVQVTDCVDFIPVIGE